MDDDLLRIAGSGGATMVPAVVAAAREAAVVLGLDAHAADDLREACRVLLTRVSSGGDGYELSASKRAGRVVVRVRDVGVPYALQDGNELLAQLRASVDAVHFRYDGRAGNEIELVKRIRRRPDIGLEDHVVERPDPDTPVEIRAMRPSDAVPFVRNVYRSYGYTYEGDWAYRAEEVVELLRSGVLHAWVAVTDGGWVAGQLAMRRDPPTTRIAEGGAAMIDPPFRHHGLAVQIGMAALSWIGEQQLEGVMGHATTRHPFSQQGFLGLGGHETALLLGYIPTSVTYRAVDHTGERRGAVMAMYRRLLGAPAQPLHLPHGDRAMLERIIAQAELDGPIAGPAAARAPEGPTHLHLDVLADHAVAIVDVVQAGADVAQRVAAQVEHLLQEEAAVYVDLPLTAPTTPATAQALYDRGLSFAGVFPRDEPSGGMRLRLQRLAPSIEVIADDIHVASDFGRELRDYAVAAQRAV
jgi:serine/threonine-protein kinase RsbW